MAVADKATGAVSYREVVLSRDEGKRPETALEGLGALRQGALKQTDSTQII